MDTTTGTSILDLLAALPGMERSADGGAVVEAVPNPFGDSEECWRYTVGAGEQIEALRLRGGETVGAPSRGTLHQLLWYKLRLERICHRYREQYESWKEANGGVDYISTRIQSEDEAENWNSGDYIRYLWGEPRNGKGGLRLLMAEYGMGKSSFCQELKRLTAETVREPFLNGEAAFPLVFDLNEFRNQDFDEFIQNRVTVRYGIPLSYACVEALCRAGVFVVVLDAWDQMHGTPSERDTIRDISQFRSLWGENGRVLITCRRSFYQKQLHMKQGVFGAEAMRQARLFALGGFDRSAAERYVLAVGQAAINADSEWMEASWKLNQDLLERPLNLRLLARHADLILRRYDLSRERLDTYQFLELILNDWQRGEARDRVLKTLVLLTLRSGLNRSVPVQAYREALGEELWEANVAALKDLEFVALRGEEIEFRLAAYQEYLWAHFVLQELNGRRLCGRDTLLNRFLLTPEARGWIKDVLSREENDCLSVQLDLIEYKNRAETGCSGGNALTLLGDLNHSEYYRRQLERRKLNDRPLHRADLHGLDLSGMNFRRADLSEANLSYTRLDGTDFSGAILSELVMDDYGQLTKCAFLEQQDGLCVVAGTEAGNVLIYSIDRRERESGAQADDIIRDISADSAGVYTASADGWVGYMNPSGKWKSAYITATGLQSIASGARDAVYVGVAQDGLYRYHWGRSSKTPIQVTDEDGAPVEIRQVEDINYYVDATDHRYIAYLSDERLTDRRRRITLLELSGAEKGVVRALCRLRGGHAFGDICFAEGYLVYSVTGLGVYARPIEGLFGEIEQEALTSENCRIFSTKLPVMLAWAGRAHRLFILEEAPQTLDQVTAIDMKDKNRTAVGYDLEWILRSKTYAVRADRVNGFSVSGDGGCLALSGERLAVFQWQREEGYYALPDEPVEARILCKNAKFEKCEGLPLTLKERLKDGGAAV